jgi:hypothetical protein
MVIGKLFYVICLICNIGLYYIMIRPTLEWFTIKGEPFTNQQNFFMSLTFLLFTYVVSFSFTSVTAILSFVGSTAQVYLMFVIPIIVYIKAFDLPTSKKYLYLFMLFILIFIGASSVILLLYNGIYEFTKKHIN